MIYRLRVILDVREDVFRDIEIQGADTLEDLHNAIVQAFSLEGQEMASFYLSDEEWNQGEEISLFDMSYLYLVCEFICKYSDYLSELYIISTHLSLLTRCHCSFS